MMKNRGFFRSIFSPRKKLVPIFSQQATFLCQASDALLGMLGTVDREEWLRFEQEVKLCEVQGDALLTEFYGQLNGNWMFPMDKIDLQTIAMNVDDFLDQVKDASKAILLYNPRHIDPQLVELGQYIQGEAVALRELLLHFGPLKKEFSAISLQCERITEIEHAADDTYEEYIGELFRRDGQDTLELIKSKNIAEALEDATDAEKKVSDALRNIVLRYVGE